MKRASMVNDSGTGLGPLPEPAQFAPSMITEDAYTVAQMISYAAAKPSAGMKGSASPL